MARVLIACEFSGTVRRAFRALGHDAWSCDLLPAEDGSAYHLQMDIFEALRTPRCYGLELMIAHPPCTYLSRAGWSWANKPDSDTLPLKGEPRRRAAFAAAKFFMQLLNAPIPRICIENPRPIVHVGLPPHTQVIQPWQFGHGETKATCLWLKNLPTLVPTHMRDDLFAQQEPTGREQRLHRLPPGPDRWKERSRTFTGIAEAMATQWGALLESRNAA